MKPSRLHLASLAFLIPLCATLFSVWWMLRDDGNRTQMKAGAHLNELLSTMVAKADKTQAGWTTRLEAVASPLVRDPTQNNLREAPKNEPLIRSAALLDSKGILIFPDRANPSLREQEFLERSADLIKEPWMPPPLETGERQESGGWQRFFWRDGVQLLYWKPLPDGSGVLLLEIERSAILADLAWRVGIPPFPDDRREGHSIIMTDELETLSCCGLTETKIAVSLPAFPKKRHSRASPSQARFRVGSLPGQRGSMQFLEPMTSVLSWVFF